MGEREEGMKKKGRGRGGRMEGDRNGERKIRGFVLRTKRTERESTDKL